MLTEVYAVFVTVERRLFLVKTSTVKKRVNDANAKSS